jgi:predicted transposase/invertase (TIGR01784 family)
MVFNDSKAYVRQIRENKSYHLLQPVYGLGIICDAFDHTTEEFYHHYQTISWYNTEEVIEGLEFVLVELEKFKPSKWEDRKMAVLWLRFLSEVEDETRDVPADLLENKEIQEALSLCEKSAFTSGELELYDQYWDYIRTMKGIVDVAKAEGLAKRKAEELAKALERTVLTAYQNKLSIEQIQAFSNLSKDDIFEILKRNKIV